MSASATSSGLKRSEEGASGSGSSVGGSGCVGVGRLLREEAMCGVRCDAMQRAMEQWRA